MRSTIKGKQKIRCLGALLLAGSLLLCGCGKEPAVAVPELIESDWSNEGYRPVEKGCIGGNVGVDVVSGYVVPEEECYFFPTSAEIEKIHVSVGQKVKAGDVLATIKVTDMHKEIDTLKQETAARNKMLEQKQIIYEETVKKLEYQMKACKKALQGKEQEKQIKALQTQKQEEEENFRYEKLDTKRKNRVASERISELGAQIADGTLKARNDGTVVFVTSLEQSGHVEPTDNVVVLADMSKKWIETTTVTLDDKLRSEAEYVYALIGGEQYPLTMREFPRDMLAMMQTTNYYANIQYALPSGLNLEIGDMIPICYSKIYKDNVLVVGLDSLVETGSEVAVYVKNANGEKEKRVIETGSRDDKFAEVCAGLTEGEMVWYDAIAMIPAHYKEVPAEVTEFRFSDQLSNFQVTDKIPIKVAAEETLIITDVLVQNGDRVNAGDVVMKAKSFQGKSETEKLRDAIADEDKTYKETTKRYQSDLAELEERLQAAKNENKKKKENKEPQEEASEAETTKTPEDYYQVEQISSDIAMLKANYKMAGIMHEEQKKLLADSLRSQLHQNDGSGKKNIYAPMSGEIQNIQPVLDVTTTAGTILYTIGLDTTKKVKLWFPASVQSLTVGQKLYFKGDNKEIVPAVTLSTNYRFEKYFYTRLNGKLYRTTCEKMSDWMDYSGMQNNYVELENPADYDIVEPMHFVYDRVYYKNALTVPADDVYIELEDDSHKECSEYYYVWKIVDGTPVKQYISVGDAYDMRYLVLSGLEPGDVIAGGE